MDTMPPALVESEIPSYVVWYTPHDSLGTSVSPMHDYSPGEIPLTCSVSATGASTVTVPIECHVDPQGFTPRIVLSYNSMAGSGPFGHGWNMTGLSIISRTPRSIYYDGGVTPVRGDSSDAFVLDGNRLIRKKSSAGKIYFQTETGNITATATLDGSQVQSFRVMHADGSTADYSVSDALGFHITRSTNPKGRTIQYGYEFYCGHWRPTEITYGMAGQGRMSFDYGEVTGMSTPSAYINGQLVAYNYLTTRITIRYNDIKLRTYGLSYMRKGASNFVSRITCQTGLEKAMLDPILAPDGHPTAYHLQLPPLYFYYGTDNSVQVFRTESSQMWYYQNFHDSPGSIKVCKGKFDYGNDNDGVIEFPNKIAYHKYDNTIFNDYSYSDTVHICVDLSRNYDISLLNLDDKFIDLFCADIDGCAGDEIIKVNHLDCGNGTEEFRFSAYGVDSAGIHQKYTRSYPLDPTQHGVLVPKEIISGDFNGDGRTEIMLVTPDELMGENRLTKCYIIDLENNRICYWQSPFQYKKILYENDNEDEGWRIWNNTDKLLPMDYDGDGKTDIVLVKDDSTYFYTFDVTDGIWSCRRTGSCPFLRNCTVENRDIHTGDFNGDGRNDLLISPVKGSSSATWTIYASTGNASFSPREIELTQFGNNTNLTSQDINLDGQTDLVVKNDSILDVYLIADFVCQRQLQTTIEKYSVFFPTDIQSGNTWYSLLSVDSAGVARRYRLMPDDSENTLLAGAISSTGIIHRFGYGCLSRDNTATYSYNNMADYPYRVFSGKMDVVNSKQTWLGGNLLENFRYTYDNAVTHLQGMGFRGFTRLYSHENVTGRESIQMFNPFRFGVPVSTETYKGRETYTYNIDVADDRTALITMTGKTSQNYADGTTSTTTYTCDNWGNTTQALTQYGDGNSEERKYTYSNTRNDTVNIIGKPTSEILRMTRNGNTWQKRQIYQYQGTFLKKVYEDRPGITLKRTLQYTYNVDGTVSKKESRNGIVGVMATETYDYDGEGRVVARTDNYGRTDSIRYDSCGRVSAVRDYLGGITRTEYDNWGKVNWETFPDSTVRTVTLTWSDGTAGSMFLTTERNTGQPSTRTYSDALGRTVRTSQKSMDGEWLSIERQYDTHGRLARVSHPFKQSPRLWTENEYDGMDRLAQVTYADNTADTYTYSGLTQTVTKGGITTAGTYNAMGDLLTSECGGQTTAYTYNGEGKPTAITAPGGITTAMTYNVAGQRILLSDPSAGDVTTTYDNLYRISQTKDARNKIVQYAYDSHDRIISCRHNGEDTTAFVYDGYGRMVSEQGGDGHGTAYTYDNLGRKASKTVSSPDGRWLRLDYTYAGGRIASVRYTSDTGEIATEHYVYANGHLKEIRLSDSTVIYRVDREDDEGRITTCMTGSISHGMGYDTSGMVVSLTSDFGQSGVSLGYTYDTATGSLVAFTDSVLSRTETYAYDNMDRLVRYGADSMAYGETGNIVRSSLAGDYTYSAEKPYAVTGITNPYGRLPETDQDITYSSQDRPLGISQGGCTASFRYDTHGNRTRMTFTGDSIYPSYTRYYLDDIYEVTVTDTSLQEVLYLGGNAYSAGTAYVRQSGGEWSLWSIQRDRQGSVIGICDNEGTVLWRAAYDAWGNMRNPDTWERYPADSLPEPPLGRGYTGHEHLTAFGLVNMNARLYDPLTARFLSPDNLVQAPALGQNYNRYSYCLNNPLKYVDKDGNSFLGALVAGALIGALFSGGTYAITTVVTGQKWNPHQFVRALGMGAVSGAFGGAIGYLGNSLCPAFANKIGFNLLSQTTNSVITNTVFGSNIDFSTFVSVGTGVLLGANLPNYTASDKGWLQNTLAEIGFNTLRGGLTGLVQGAVNAGLKRDPRYLAQGMIGGALGGFSRTALMNAIFGSPFVPEGIETKNALCRSGGIANLITQKEEGITLGKNIYTHDKNDKTLRHESMHIRQQEKISITYYLDKEKNYQFMDTFSGGWAQFYGDILRYYLTHGMVNNRIEMPAYVYGNTPELVDFYE